MWSYVCPEMLKAIEAEPETDVLAEHFNSLARCVYVMYGRSNPFYEKWLSEKQAEYFKRKARIGEVTKGKDKMKAPKISDHFTFPEDEVVSPNSQAPLKSKTYVFDPDGTVVSHVTFNKPIKRCVELLGAGCLNEQHMTDLVAIMQKSFAEHFERQGERNKKRTDEDYDADVEEQLEEEDDEDVFVLSKLGDLIHAFFATHKEAMAPVFEQILPAVVKLLDRAHPWTDHQWGLCIFDDVIEYLGPASAKYQEHFVAPMMHYLTDQHPEVRQAAAYGCGVLGQFGGPGYAAICAQSLPLLTALISDPKSREVENINPTENAISAVTKILKFNASQVNVDEILPVWLSWLPVYEDVDESPYVYGYLCDLVEANHPAVLGANNANLPKVIQIMADALMMDAMPMGHEVKTRVINLCKQVQVIRVQK